MLIIDGHEDIAYNALEWGRDIRLSAYAIREREKAQGLARGIAMSGLPDLRRGGFGIVFGVIFTFPMPAAAKQDKSQSSQSSQFSQSYHNAEEAHAAAQQQLAYYKALTREPGVSLILKQRDVTNLVRAWEESSPDDEQRPFGIVPLMEGADPIRTPAEAAQWFEDGVRIVGLAWQGTRYSGGTSAPGPLTPAGQVLLKEMDRTGLILDTSHLAEESFWQALDTFSGPVIASHSNCRAITPTDRHLSDDMIRALTARNGIIGVVPVNFFLNSTWNNTNRFPLGLDQVVRHIDHICQFTGDALHVGIGSDVDGGFGRDETPAELDTVADIATLADTLRSSGYSEEDVISIMGGNWRRFLMESLPA